MKPIYKIYIAIAAAILLAIGIIGGSAWSNYKVGKLESAVEAAKQTAIERENSAAIAEQNADQYKAKIEYLEQQLAGIQNTARKQDEKLKTQNTNTARARRDVERSLTVRSIDANAVEICAKLDELGHPCE